MRLHFLGSFDVADYQRLGVTKSDDLLILRYPELYRDKIRVEMRKIVEKNAKNKANGKEPVEINVELDIHYLKRSLDQNAWLWKAHEIEARLINTKDQIWRDGKGITWYKPGAITPEEIHESYNERYSPRATLDVEANNVPFFRKMLTETTGKIVNEICIDSGHVRFTIWKTSSYMNVAEFCQLSEHVKENLLSYGVDLENASDYSALITDLDTWEREAEKKEAEANAPQSTDSVEILEPEIPILTLRKDPVKIVKDVFKGETICK